MNRNTLGIVGLSIPFIFLFGLLLMFFNNPNTWDEVNSVFSLASFNIEQLDVRVIAGITYLLVGILNVIFVVGLFQLSKNDMPVVLGKVVILIIGLIWISFGIISWNLDSEFEMHTVIFRVVAILILAPVGYFFIGIEFDRVIEDSFSKYYTLGTGFCIILLGFLSLFVFNDETWIRTNISIILYFVWFGVLGIRFIQVVSKKPVL